MKKLITLFTILVTASITAQNFQLHRDFERGHFTSTLELFKMDKYGNTFTFIDFDYNSATGVSGAYYEIARVLKTETMPVGLHVEYNAGVGTFKAGNATGGYTIDEAWIFGVNYEKANAKWGFSTYAGYKAFTGAEKANFQVTGTWYYNIIEDKLTFAGFADLWTQNYKGAEDLTVFLSEPQLWYHLNKTFSVGGELEISSNFAGGSNAIKGRPTLAIKWNI
ncbi:DUF5020 family protein [Lutibacter maritimus]|jgi:hypothetical protein|uniref:DUF5020 domain-containing protein n=1 Tax=Lutibacter maritimus TaxID=593133 RepID=A0A1I6SL02_9FLAO|nr:DUF5020 family protein [Lutibacter maritimus]SFS77611.1 protein of unknown function [Lutibacter maritimus]